MEKCTAARDAVKASIKRAEELLTSQREVLKFLERNPDLDRYVCISFGIPIPPPQPIAGVKAG